MMSVQMAIPPMRWMMALHCVGRELYNAHYLLPVAQESRSSGSRSPNWIVA